MGIFNQDKKLGFGLMRLPLTDPDSPKTIDIEQAKEMVDIFIKNGFTYFDTAQMYHSFRSEKATKEILTSRYPRESYTLATKMHQMYFKNGEELDDILKGSLERCGVDYFDYYLMHDLGHDNYDIFVEKGCFEWAVAKKEEGVFKHIGFSCHDDKSFLRKILTEHPEMEFVQIQLNYLDWDAAGLDAHGNYDVISEFGKEIVVMEPVKGGVLANVPDSVQDLFRSVDADASVASWAVRFAASLDNVKMVLSGMSSVAQMEDNISYMSDFQPLTDEERAVIDKAVELINADIAIPCTSCSYCVDGCPMNIPIPRYFSLYNTELREFRTDWTPQREHYSRLGLNHGKASDCIGCGQCESICPQHLPIIEDLKVVAERFEKEDK